MLKELPRAKLANLPTPLHEAKHLSRVMGGAKILFKRDDATGLVLGGQKTRMLEYPLGDAVARGYDVIVTTGAEDTNHTSQLVACANKLGMDSVIVLYKRIQKELTGNALLDNLLDPVIIETEFRFQVYDPTLPEEAAGASEEKERINQMLDDIIDDLQKHGRHPYKMHFKTQEPYAPSCMVGFVYCAQEITQQLKEMGETAQYLYVAHASGSSQGGLVLGAKYFHAPFKVIGVLTILGHRREDRMVATAKITNEASDLLGANITVEPTEIVVRGEYIGPETWGVFQRATKKGIEAIRLVAKTEGIFLDPHYTGKAMAALLDDIQQGKLTSKDTVIFYHTGGAPNIFPYTKELQVENRTIKSLHR